MRKNLENVLFFTQNLLECGCVKYIVTILTRWKRPYPNAIFFTFPYTRCFARNLTQFCLVTNQHIPQFHQKFKFFFAVHLWMTSIKGKRLETVNFYRFAYGLFQKIRGWSLKLQFTPPTFLSLLVSIESNILFDIISNHETFLKYEVRLVSPTKKYLKVNINTKYKVLNCI